MGSVRSYRSVSAGRNEVSWRALHVQLMSRILRNIGRRSNYKKIHKRTKIIYFLWQLCYV